jgi:hypothetical protein
MMRYWNVGHSNLRDHANVSDNCWAVDSAIVSDNCWAVFGWWCDIECWAGRSLKLMRFFEATILAPESTRICVRYKLPSLREYVCDIRGYVCDIRGYVCDICVQICAWSCDSCDPARVYASVVVLNSLVKLKWPSDYAMIWSLESMVLSWFCNDK